MGSDVENLFSLIWIHLYTCKVIWCKTIIQFFHYKRIFVVQNVGSKWTVQCSDWISWIVICGQKIIKRYRDPYDRDPISDREYHIPYISFNVFCQSFSCLLSHDLFFKLSLTRLCLIEQMNIVLLYVNRLGILYSSNSWI